MFSRRPGNGTARAISTSRRVARVSWECHHLRILSTQSKRVTPKRELPMTIHFAVWLLCCRSFHQLSSSICCFQLPAVAFSIAPASVTTTSLVTALAPPSPAIWCFPLDPSRSFRPSPFFFLLLVVAGFSYFLTIFSVSCFSFLLLLLKKRGLLCTAVTLHHQHPFVSVSSHTAVFVCRYYVLLSCSTCM